MDGIVDSTRTKHKHGDDRRHREEMDCNWEWIGRVFWLKIQVQYHNHLTIMRETKLYVGHHYHSHHEPSGNRTKVSKMKAFIHSQIEKGARKCKMCGASEWAKNRKQKRLHCLAGYGPINPSRSSERAHFDIKATTSGVKGMKRMAAVKLDHPLTRRGDGQSA